MKDVQYKNLDAGQTVVFEMKLKRSKFLVKNFTSGIISVTLGENENSSIIGAESWEVVFNNVEDTTTGMAEATNKVTVQSTGSGLVEIASIDFYYIFDIS